MDSKDKYWQPQSTKEPIRRCTTCQEPYLMVPSSSTTSIVRYRRRCFCEDLESPNLPEFKWIRRPILPKTKKRRIRKKWLKKYPQGVSVRCDAYLFGNRLLGHPNNIAILIDSMSPKPKDDTDGF